MPFYFLFLPVIPTLTLVISPAVQTMVEEVQVQAIAVVAIAAGLAAPADQAIAAEVIIAHPAQAAILKVLQP